MPSVQMLTVRWMSSDHTAKSPGSEEAARLWRPADPDTEGKRLGNSPRLPAEEAVCPGTAGSRE